MQSQVQRKAIEFIKSCGLSDVKILGVTHSEAFGIAHDCRNGNSLVDAIEQDGGKLVKKSQHEVWLNYNGGFVQVQKFQRSFMFHLYADQQTAKLSNKNFAF